jgi:hypothetical protein
VDGTAGEKPRGEAALQDDDGNLAAVEGRDWQQIEERKADVQRDHKAEQATEVVHGEAVENLHDAGDARQMADAQARMGAEQ